MVKIFCASIVIQLKNSTRIKTIHFALFQGSYFFPDVPYDIPEAYRLML